MAVQRVVMRRGAVGSEGVRKARDRRVLVAMAEAALGWLAGFTPRERKLIAECRAWAAWAAENDAKGMPCREWDVVVAKMADLLDKKSV